MHNKRLPSKITIVFALLYIARISDAAEPAFTEISIDAAFRVDHPALIANLGGDSTPHLVLTGQGDDYEQQMAIYRLDLASGGNASLVAALVPRESLIGFDIARIGSRELLLFVDSAGIHRFDLEARELVEFLDTRSYYRRNRNGAIEPLNFFRDLDLDEKDDLILPDIDGYRVRLQLADGEIGPETLLQDSVVMSLSGGSVSFDGHILVSGDMDFDGLTDLIYWSGDDLGVYAQLPDQQFSDHPTVAPSGLGVLSEEEQQALEDGVGAIDREGLAERDIESIADLNADRIPDIVAEASFSEGVFDRSNEISIHLGREQEGQVVYSSAEDSLISYNGLQYTLIRTDIDGDEKQDFGVLRVRLSFGRVIRALISGSVAVQIHFFRMTDDDTYPEEANYVAKTRVRFSRKSGQVDIPAIDVADVDGDGMQELILQTGTDELSIFAGESTQELFARKPHIVNVVLPRNGQLVRAEDINDDGRADLVLRYSEADGEGMERRVRLLVSREGE